jgi:hypothetical protein
MHGLVTCGQWLSTLENLRYFRSHHHADFLVHFAKIIRKFDDQ